LGEITAHLIGCSEKWRMHPPFVGKFDSLSELAQLAIPTNGPTCCSNQLRNHPPFVEIFRSISSYVLYHTLCEITARLIGCSEKWRMHPPFVGKFDVLRELAHLAIPTNGGSIRRLSKYFDLSLVIYLRFA
jgi:hypothetical protein